MSTVSNPNPPLFRKRTLKGNVRSKKGSEDNSEDKNNSNLDDDHADVKSIMELKLEQSFRKRRIGIDTEGLNGKDSGKSSSGRAKTEDIKDMMGSQFASQAVDLSAGPVAHEKIMEAYVSEKLGDIIGKPQEEKAEAPRTHDDELYRIPDDIKALEGRDHNSSETRGERERDGDIGVTGSTGLDEVALPIEFKLRNIEETEAARMRLIDDKKQRKREYSLTHSNTLALGTASARLFQQEKYNKPRVFPGSTSMEPVEISVSAGVSSSQTMGPSTQDHLDKQRLPKGVERSTDDMILDKFKKRQRQMRR
mmetsp:Transcript_7618/g.7849  ORF Transcript_7618/g.7849 Transcript_7618/m.7849 type:complete len:308 (+) Transcript_7618:105-1028(+)